MPIHHPLGFKQHPLEDAGRVYIPIIRMPIKGGMTIIDHPQYFATFDHCTNEHNNKVFSTPVSHSFSAIDGEKA